MTEIVRSEIDPTAHRETIVLRNAHGAEHHIIIRIGAYDLREAEIQKARDLLDRLEAEVDAHAARTGAKVLTVPASEGARQRAESAHFD